MSSASRAALRARRSNRASDRTIFMIVGGVIAAALIVAIVLSRPTGSTQGGQIRETAPVIVSGEALPDFTATAGDAAIGMAMPEISGVDFAGRPIRVTDDGRPKIILFLAHWCPHCQAEVPVVQDWIDGGATEGTLDIYSIATATDSSRPNYPPSEWLAGEGWVAPTVVDDDASSAGLAAGVTSYPFFVFVDVDGAVSSRAAGRLSIDQIEAAVAALTTEPMGGTDE